MKLDELNGRLFDLQVQLLQVRKMPLCQPFKLRYISPDLTVTNYSKPSST